MIYSVSKSLNMISVIHFLIITLNLRTKSNIFSLEVIRCRTLICNQCSASFLILQVNIIIITIKNYSNR